VSAPVTDQQQALAAVLDAGDGAVLTDASGAALWGVPGFDLLPAEVLRTKTANRRPVSFGRGHWTTELRSDMVTVLDGIPVLRPSYLALRLFATVHPKRAERAVATMLSMRVATVGSLEQVVKVMGEHGRNGIVLLRAFVEEERRRGTPAGSGLERRFESVLVENGEKPMRRQVNVGGQEAWVGRTDFLDQDYPFIVEVDDERHHGALIDQDADAVRTAALEAAGFTVKHFWDDDLFQRPAYVVSEVRRIRRELRRARHGKRAA
jgi:very-short-patch-repair endonuclease